MTERLLLQAAWLEHAHEGYIQKINGVLLPMPASCKTGFLVAAALPAVTALHKNIRDSLTPEQKSFMLEKGAAYFAKHFSASSNAIIGITHDGVLIAISTVVCPHDNAPYLWHENVVPPCADEQLSVLQGVCVSKPYRGNGLMQSMLLAWERHAHQHDKTHLLAEVEPANQHSLGNFLDAGFMVWTQAIDKSDGAAVLILVKCLTIS